MFGKRKSAKLSTEKDYISFAKQLMALSDALNQNRFALYRTSFLRGVATGVGSVLGATIVIAILLWVLSLLGQVPFVGPITDNVRSTIEEGN